MTILTISVVALGVLLSAGFLAVYRNLSALRRELSARQPASSPPGGEPEAKVSGVSRQTIHDLNNIIGTISGFTDAALGDLPSSSPLRSDLQEVLEAAERAKRLVAKLRRDSAPSMEEKRASTAPAKRISPRTSVPPRRISSPPASAESLRPSRRSSYPPVAKPVSVSETYLSGSTPDKVPEAPASGLPLPSSIVSGTASTAERAPGPSSNGAEHLLIVDDEIQLLTMFRRVFEPRGYQVTTFSSGLLAWDDFQKHGDLYDLAILDQRMPEMSGTSLAIEILNSRPDFPIILLSGFSDTITPDDAARIGIRRFLSKPIPQAELADTIRKTLDETQCE